MTLEREVPETRDIARAVEALRTSEQELRFHAKRLVQRLGGPNAPVLHSEEAFDRLCLLVMALKAERELGNGVTLQRGPGAIDVVAQELHQLLGLDVGRPLGLQEFLHLLDMLAGYGMAARYIRMLRRYQQGRLGDREARTEDGDGLNLQGIING